MSRSKRPLWIVKAGSRMVIDGGPGLVRNWMKQVDQLDVEFGVDVIWVTSGAIATAKRSITSVRESSGAFSSGTPKSHRPMRLAEKQALSALGQPMVMNVYNSALKRLGREGSQVLLTADDLAHRPRRENLVQTLTTLIQWRCLPILNENDAVSTEEIQFGDNDRLSALVARHMNADRLILLTDVDGLFDSDPKKNAQAKLVRELRNVTPSLVKSLSSDSPSGVGTGGMLSKVTAARLASQRGITTHLVRGNESLALLRIARSARGEKIEAPGTLIHPRRK